MKSITLLYFVLTAIATTPPAKWQNPTNWRNIKPGIIPKRAAAMLGDPVETETARTSEIWYYADTPTAETRPKHGLLIFRKTPQGMVLYKFAEPNWKTIPSWQQLQADYKQSIAEQTAEKKRIAVETNKARFVERRATMQRRAEKRVAQRQAVIPRPPREYKTPPAKPDLHTKFTSRYFIIIGGSFFVVAFIIAGSHGFKLFKG